MKKKVLVGGTVRDSVNRAIHVLKQAERGVAVKAQRTVTFSSWSTLAAVMTDRRHEIIRLLRATPMASVKAVSRAVGRDYKRVYEDVKALEAAGLIDHEGGQYSVGYDEIRTSIIARAA
jgi:predicted transcriptional regulator